MIGITLLLTSMYGYVLVNQLYFSTPKEQAYL